MDLRLLGGALIFHALLTTALVLVSRDIPAVPVACFVVGAVLVATSRLGRAPAAGDDAAAQPGPVDVRAPTPPPEPRVLAHGQGLQRMGPPSTSEAAVGEATEARTFVPDFSAQAMPGLVDIYREIQKGAIHGYLLVVAGPNRAAGVAIRDGEIRIGRGQDATLQLTDGRVSNQQCSVLHRAGGTVVIDAGSRNGTYLNNERVSGETRLGNCDVLAFGGTKILVALPMDDGDRADRSGPDDVTAERPIAGA